MFKDIKAAPPDAILGLTEAFKKDENPDKVNLGVGVFKDEQGTTPVLQCVKEAERRLLDQESSKSYMPISGDPEYGKCVQQLLFSDENLIGSGRLQTAHTPGGTGGLRVAAETFKKFYDTSAIWLSSPTWANHKGVLGAVGIELKEYPYYDAEQKGVNYAGMLDTLKQVPAGDAVLLHVCCHNPTGADLSAEQWQEVAELAADRGWLPFLDFAYQGFGSSLAEDRKAVDILQQAGVPLFIASSFSKNFGLYNERTGAFTLSLPEPEASAALFSHVKKLIRANYSNPPAHGGHIVKTVLQDDTLKQQWTAELNGMRDRIKEVRSGLVNKLNALISDVDFSFIEQQNGMFSFSGLNEKQVQFLRDQKSIYIVKSGRINVAGVTPGNMDYVCESIAESYSAV